MTTETLFKLIALIAFIVEVVYRIAVMIANAIKMIMDPVERARIMKEFTLDTAAVNPV